MSILSRCALALLFGAIMAPAAWADAPAIADAWPACQARWQSQAKSQQLADRVTQDLIPGLQPVERVLELDRSQPEFTTTFGQYLERRLTRTRIEKGREMYQRHAVLLNNLTREYGVPGRYLVAFWGLETNFGGYLGNMPTLDSLATLACDPRRSDYFTRELLTALQLVEVHDLDPARMRGSWAGAMGHTQFMPSNYATYGRDGDGDGRIQLWDSIPDALTSAAYFLNRLGWEEEVRWGREVRLPDDFDYALTGRKNSRPLADWARMGVRKTNGAQLPPLPLKSAVLVPSGHRGPAFLVYPNFRVIMRWNNSESYALSVGLLADRIAGAGPLQNPPPVEATRLRRETVKAAQQRLNALGFDAGPADGILGPGTRGAIRDFQASRGLIADGHYSTALLKALELPLD